jgi:hypothetical protein
MFPIVFNIVENTPGTLASLMDNGTQGTLLNFTGSVTVTNGQMFTVTHDDGLTLIIGGTNLGFNPGPTAPIISTATYTGPSGTFPFQLVYAECCGRKFTFDRRLFACTSKWQGDRICGRATKRLPGRRIPTPARGVISNFLGKSLVGRGPYVAKTPLPFGLRARQPHPSVRFR